MFSTQYLKNNSSRKISVRVFKNSSQNEYFIKCKYDSELISFSTVEEFIAIFNSSIPSQKRFKEHPESKALLKTLDFLNSKEKKDSLNLCIFEELIQRGYNLESVKIEVFLKGSVFKKKVGRQSPGRLRSLYAKDGEGLLDTMVYWHTPGCSRQDANMLFHYFSGPAYSGPDLPKFLNQLGLDPLSFEFKVDHFLKTKKAAIKPLS